MRLSVIRIRNFKGIDTLEVQIPKTDSEREGSADFLALLGENNAGKSSILEALLLAFPNTGHSRPMIDHFPSRLTDNGPIIIDLTFDQVTDEEAQRHGIRGHVHNGEYRIRKKWTSDGEKPTVEAFTPSITVPELDSALEGKTNVHQASRALQALSGEWPNIIRAFQDESGVDFSSKALKREREALRQYVIKNHKNLVRTGNPTWSMNPGGIPANPDSSLPTLIYVPAVKDINDEASPSGKGAAQHLMRLLFERALSNHEKVEAFRQAAEAVQELFHNTSGERAVIDLQEMISGRLRRLIDVSVELGFEPPDPTRNLARSTTLQVLDRDVLVDPRHQGHGAQRALILTLLEVYAEQSAAQQRGDELGNDNGLLLLIEEPEIYLHPHMARRMRSVLVNIARSGTGQVVCTTHSPAFLDLADRHDGIALLRRDGDELGVCQRSDDVFVGDDRESARKRLRMLLDFDPAVSEVVFAKRVCLVEGDTEQAALWATARHLASEGEVDMEKARQRLHETTVVNCKGKWTIAAIQTVLNGFQIPYRVVHDADAEGDGGANARILDLLGGDNSRRLLHSPDFEGEVWGEDWSSDKPWRAHRKIAADGTNDALRRFLLFVLDCTIEDLQ